MKLENLKDLIIYQSQNKENILKNIFQTLMNLL